MMPTKNAAAIENSINAVLRFLALVLSMLFLCNPVQVTAERSDLRPNHVRVI
jgi:hypothetical protein